MQELVEIIYRCNPEADAVGQITWEPDGLLDAAESWHEWLRTCFRPVLLPHLIGVFQQAAVQGVRELCRAAWALDAQLSPASRERSLEAGEALRFQKAPRGDRAQHRFLEEVRAGRAPGHFVTLFGLRAAGFSVPLRTATLAYLLQELIGGRCSPGLVDRLLKASLPEINAALGTRGMRAEGGTSLHG